MQTAIEIVRIIVVLALVAFAAVLLTPKGRVPLALRGIARLLGRTTLVSRETEGVSLNKRLGGALLLVLAFVLAVIRI